MITKNAATALGGLYESLWPATMGLVPFWQPSTLCCSSQFPELYCCIEENKPFLSHCERLNRYVFSFDSNAASDIFSRTAGGRLFHTAGPLYLLFGKLEAMKCSELTQTRH